MAGREAEAQGVVFELVDSDAYIGVTFARRISKLECMAEA